MAAHYRLQATRRSHIFSRKNRHGVLEVRLPDGRTAQAQLVPVQTVFSERVGWAAILRDITVLKELEQMKSDFVNTVSHDLKNPITSIILSTHLLRSAGPLNEKQTRGSGTPAERGRLYAATGY